MATFPRLLPGVLSGPVRVPVWVRVPVRVLVPVPVGVFQRAAQLFQGSGQRRIRLLHLDGRLPHIGGRHAGLLGPAAEFSRVLGIVLDPMGQ
jgi:hypothetical protein